MSKINKNSINLSFRILTLLAFSLLIIPATASAARSAGRNVVYGDNFSQRDRNIEESNENIVIQDESYGSAKINPRPIIYSISPKALDRNNMGAEITLTGKGFVPGSVARINGTDRPTAFVDSNHLVLQATANDMYRADKGFYINVYNSGPGGGYSNSKFFEVNNVALSQAPGSVLYPGTPYRTENVETFSTLTSNAVFGRDSFLPSGIIQWLLFAIMILCMILIARKFFGQEEAYHATPLKHD